jgi:hypothetical protein
MAERIVDQFLELNQNSFTEVAINKLTQYVNSKPDSSTMSQWFLLFLHLPLFLFILIFFLAKSNFELITNKLILVTYFSHELIAYSLEFTNRQNKYLRNNCNPYICCSEFHNADPNIKGLYVSLIYSKKD